MNEERFRLITEKDVSDSQWIGSPVQLLTYKLEFDFQYNRSVLTLSLSNLSFRTIKSVYFEIKCLDDAGDLVGVLESAAIQNVSAQSDSVFGTISPILIHYTTVTDLVFSIQKVVFEDGTVWRAKENEKITHSVSKLMPIAHNSADMRILKRDCSFLPRIRYFPAEFDSYWCCTCGAINQKNDPTCFNCGGKKDFLLTHFSTDYLSSEIEKEKTEEIYQSALQSMDTEEIALLLSSAEKLEGIPHYKNSHQMAIQFRKRVDELKEKEELQKKEELYQSAIAEKTTVEEFQQAAQIMKSLGKYKDAEKLSASYRQTATGLINARKQQQKKELAEAEKAKLAAKQKLQKSLLWVSISIVFILFIGGFAFLCVSYILPNRSDTYQEAQTYYENQQYTYAWNLFKSLGSYKDSEEKVKEISILFTGKEDATFTLTVDTVDPCYSITDDGALSFDSDYYVESGILNIPDVVDDILVTSIADRGFQNLTWLTDIFLPDHLTTIGQYAFKGCTSLKNVYLSQYTTSIGSYAFQNCTSLTTLTLPEGLSVLGSYAFSYCTSLQKIEIPSTVTQIKEHTFTKCTSLQQIEWGGVQEIGSYAFEYCSGLTTLQISDTITSLSGYAFSNCTGLQEVMIGNSVSSIGNSAFGDCNSLQTVSLSLSVQSIGYSAFGGCLLLDTVQYSGSEADFQQISVAEGNESLLSAKRISAQ
jgi:hypothetical protein